MGGGAGAAFLTIDQLNGQSRELPEKGIRWVFAGLDRTGIHEGSHFIRV